MIDSDGVRKAGKSNFPSNIEQAPVQSLSGNFSTSSAGTTPPPDATSSTGDPQAALQAIM